MPVTSLTGLLTPLSQLPDGTSVLKTHSSPADFSFLLQQTLASKWEAALAQSSTIKDAYSQVRFL